MLSHLKKISADKDSCETHLRKIICVVDPPQHEKDRYQNGRACLETPDSYKNVILQTYASFPIFIQQKICGLEKIYIEKEFFGPAWSERGQTGLIGIRLKEVIANLDAEKYLSWFEQQSFHATADFKVDDTLPKIRFRPEAIGKSSFLIYALLHEMGHIFDYEYHFTDEICDESGKKCQAKKDSFTTLSWLNQTTARSESEFPLRHSICLNQCKDKFIRAKDTNKLYEQIYAHGFMSQLALINAQEDFTEGFAIYVLSYLMDTHLSVVASDRNFSLDEEMTSTPYLNKLHYYKNKISWLQALAQKHEL